MDDFLTLAQSRHSVRAYRDQPVSDEDLDRVLEAARLAPTACNLQAFRLLVVRDAARREALCAQHKAAWLRQAPVIVVGCTVPEEAWTRSNDGKNHADIDLAIVIDHLTLAAAELGLGSCWICAFDPAKVRVALEIPLDLEPAVLLPLGYSNDKLRSKTRKPVHELVVYDQF